MSIIVNTMEWTSWCFSCAKVLKSSRRYTYFCGYKCKKMGPTDFNLKMDSLIDQPVVNENIIINKELA